MGVAQSECETFSMTLSCSNRSSFFSAMGLYANGRFLGLKYLGIAPLGSVNLACIVEQQPKPGLNNSE